MKYIQKSSINTYLSIYLSILICQIISNVQNITLESRISLLNFFMILNFVINSFFK